MTVEHLRAAAIRRAFFAPTTLKRAINKLGFVQADPIRSPARAQDLILRHRVKDYRAGDLERRYPRLDIEEDFLYAYGFLPRPNWRLLHPRDYANLTAIEKDVLRVVEGFGRMHPRELEVHLGRERTINDWGGYSKATTRALHHLHYRGLLRVADRENGIRIYEPAKPLAEHLSPGERLKEIVLLLVRIFAPVSSRSLREILRFLRRAAPGVTVRSSTVDTLVRSGDLHSADVDDLLYVWPAGRFSAAKQVPPSVRLLAPFDPLVWDRRRFEHLWGWRYRFEAYTPSAKRQLGYYAMPMLWLDRVIGWANVSVQTGEMTVETGFVEKRPAAREFRHGFEEELERLRAFLSAKRIKRKKR